VFGLNKFERVQCILIWLFCRSYETVCCFIWYCYFAVFRYMLQRINIRFIRKFRVLKMFSLVSHQLLPYMLVRY